MYFLEVKPSLKKKFLKLTKKNPKQMEMISKKSEEIIQDPHRYKNLRKPLNHWKRVRIDNHFVLTFSIDETFKKVILEDYEHHDRIYKTRS